MRLGPDQSAIYAAEAIQDVLQHDLSLIRPEYNTIQRIDLILIGALAVMRLLRLRPDLGHYMPSIIGISSNGSPSGTGIG